MNVRVNAVRKTRSGGLAVERQASEDDLCLLKECKKFDDLELKIESLKKISSKLVIFDVENKTTNKGIYERIV